VLGGVDYLRSLGNIDMRRIGIWGVSYGGFHDEHGDCFSRARHIFGQAPAGRPGERLGKLQTPFYNGGAA